MTDSHQFRIQLSACGHDYKADAYEHRRAANGWPEIHCGICGVWSEGHTITRIGWGKP